MRTSAPGRSSAKKSPGWKRQPIAQAGRGHVVVEQRLDDRQVEAAAADVVVCERDLDRDAALRAADVDHGLVAVPGKRLRDRLAGPRLLAVIALANPRSRSGSE